MTRTKGGQKLAKKKCYVIVECPHRDEGINAFLLGLFSFFVSFIAFRF